ncbi:MAG: hypothetical protein CR978_01520 [Gammaproteobacteria bacterium]|nr:MAG: hypothetical protein CR978_01520 [Gammaproteobacteria bacterium]
MINIFTEKRKNQWQISALIKFYWRVFIKGIDRENVMNFYWQAQTNDFKVFNIAAKNVRPAFTEDNSTLFSPGNMF